MSQRGQLSVDRGVAAAYAQIAGEQAIGLLAAPLDVFQNAAGGYFLGTAIAAEKFAQMVEGVLLAGERVIFVVAVIGEHRGGKIVERSPAHTSRDRLTEPRLP